MFRTPLPNSNDESSPLIALSTDLQELPMMNASQQAHFLNRILNRDWQVLPPYALKHLLLPRLAQLRQILLRQGPPISAEEIRVLFGPGSVALLEDSGDFGCLLGQLAIDLLDPTLNSTHLPLFLQLLPPWMGKTNAFSDKILSALIALFNTSPLPPVRFGVLKCLQAESLTIPPKILTSDVLRLVARGQGDVEVPIRLESWLLLSKIMPSLAGDVRAKVAGPAICKALSDLSVQVRLSALKTIKSDKAWLEWVPKIEELTGRVGPALLSVAGRGGEEGLLAVECLERVYIPRLKVLVNSCGDKRESISSTSSKRIGNTSNTSSYSVSNNNVSTTSNTSTSTSNTTASTINISASSNITTTSSATLSPTDQISDSISNLEINRNPIKPPSSSKLRLGSIKKIT